MSSLHLLKRETPWIVPEATIFLNGLLTKDMSVLEFGSGGSTLFFSRRVKSVVSFESDKEWYKIVRLTLRKRKIDNVRMVFYNPLRMRRRMPIDKFDCILIDPKLGKNAVDRDWLFKRSLGLLSEKTKILILDNYSTFASCGMPERHFLKLCGLSLCNQINFNNSSWYGTGTKIIYSV